MEIKHSDDGAKGYFSAKEGDIKAGLMTYVWVGEDKFIIDHTEGNPDFKGIGRKLLDAAVTYARENNKKIIPLCPFAKKMFDKTPEIHDVLSA